MCSRIQLYVLLSPDLSVLSVFLYLNLYLLGDAAPISKGSFMRTKHIYVLIHIRIKGEVGKTCLSSPVKYLLTVPRRCFLCGSFLLFMFHVCLYFIALSVPCGLVIC